MSVHRMTLWSWLFQSQVVFFFQFDDKISFSTLTKKNSFECLFTSLSQPECRVFFFQIYLQKKIKTCDRTLQGICISSGPTFLRWRVHRMGKRRRACLIRLGNGGVGSKVNPEAFSDPPMDGQGPDLPVQEWRPLRLKLGQMVVEIWIITEPFVP